VFIRPGYQKNAALHKANARPREVVLQPLLRGEAAVTTVGEPTQAVLQDGLGWQEVVVPVPAGVSGFSLKIAGVYPGTKYEDACISDVQVFVDADDEHKPALEAMAMEEVRRFVVERRNAASRGARRRFVELAPTYRLAMDVDLEEEVPPEHAARVAALRRELQKTGVLGSLVEKLQSLDSNEPAIPGWTRVRVARLPGGATGVKVALPHVSSHLARVMPLAHARAVAFFESPFDQEMEKRARRQDQQDRMAVAGCEKDCEKQRKADAKAAGEIPEYGYTCSQECTEIVGNDLESELVKARVHDGVFVSGSLKTPALVLQRGAYVEGGDRDAWVTSSRTLVAYGADGLATASVTLGTNFTAYLLEWETRTDGPARLKAVTELVLLNANNRPITADANYTLTRWEG
jgi:hypothetical protein